MASAIGHKLDQAKDTVKQLAQLTDAHDRKLDEALTAFRAHLGRAHVRPEGGITTFGITAQKRVDALVEHLGKLGLAKTPLNKVNATFIEEWLIYWKSRPVTKRTGKMCSVNWVRDVVKILREFIRWLNASSEFEWRKPVDYEVRPLRIRRTNEEKARRLVPKYTREQLGILWEYASPIERVYMILGLNCGFGAGEINTLRLDEIKQSKDKDGSIKHRICHTRTKTGVYGEWSLWPETVAAIEWYRNKLRPTSTSPHLFLTRNGTPLALPSENGNRNLAIQNAWKRLTERIRKVDHPGFPEMSFNKLRKTSSNYVRRKYSDEVADMFLCHGKLEMVDAYTDRPFAKVHKAVRRLQKLLSSVLVPVAWPEDGRKTNPSLSRGQIKRIVELRGQGYRINKIAEAMEITRDTVRKYLKQASAPELAK